MLRQLNSMQAMQEAYEEFAAELELDGTETNAAEFLLIAYEWPERYSFAETTEGLVVRFLASHRIGSDQIDKLTDYMF